MYNQMLIKRLESIFKNFNSDEAQGKDLYSYVASLVYDVPYEDCREWKNDRPNPDGKDRRSKVKQLIIPVIAECGGALHERAKIKYRPHRLLLSEAMSEYREFDSVEGLIEHVVNNNHGMISAEDVVIGQVIGDDHRIGWNNCRHVLVKRFGGETYDIPQCIGWCDLGEDNE